MYARNGIATGGELKELAWRLGESIEESKQVINLFSELYCNGRHPFLSIKESIVPDLFVVDNGTYQRSILSSVF